MKSINPSWFRFLKVGCTQQGEWTSVCYRQASFTQGNISDQRKVKGAFKYYVILLGEGGVTKKVTKDHMGEGEFTKRSQRIMIMEGGWGGMQKIWPNGRCSKRK